MVTSGRLESDLNFPAVLSFAVTVLGLKPVIVCGHHGCGGIKAAIKEQRHGIVADRVQDVANTLIDRDTWKKGQEFAIHGWIYRLADGLIRDLEVTARIPEDID